MDEAESAIIFKVVDLSLVLQQSMSTHDGDGWRVFGRPVEVSVADG